MFIHKLRQIGLVTVLATALIQLPSTGLIAQEAAKAQTGVDGAAPQTGPNPAVAGAAPASAVVAPAGGGDEAVIAKGLAIFTANCKQCHAMNEQVVGPALKDVHKRWPSDAALAYFIKYPQKVIDGGDPYAKALYDKYKQYMPNHAFLADEEISAVITWIKKESDAPAVVAATATSDVNAAGGTTASAGSGTDATTMNIVLVVLLIVLVIVLLILVVLVSIISKAVNANQEIPTDEREFVTSNTNWGGIFKSPAFRTIVILVFSIVLFKAGYDKVYAIGIQQGYAPKQPIAFSHKLHAGMYEIQCQYCHTGVERGKSATIPSVNICMNCHNAIKTESPEIKKLWTAVEKNRPIEWVRVHNLPDLAYFNHAQHVKVGGIECQTCHGAIQEMEVVQQHSTLTMGWCINCHRQTAVKAKDNAYYDKLLYLHKQTKKGEMRVADIGGLECSKCHY